MTTLRAATLAAMLSPHAWERCIAHAPVTRPQIDRLYSRSKVVHDRGMALRRTGRRVVAASLQDAIVGFNENTIRVLFARTSDPLQLLALVYSHSPRGLVR
jgi:hypothetical protein